MALDDAFGMLPLPLPYCSLRIQYSGAPGSVTGEVSSVESRGSLVIDNRVANEGNGWAGSGAHPWHLDDQTESILFLTNMSETECPIGFHMKALGVDYFLATLRLAPHETRALNLRKLRDGQKPDFKGNKLPAQATDGSVLWIRAAALPVMGRLVVLQRNKGMASNYDCSGCPCKPVLDTQQAITVLPSSGYLLVNGTQPYTAAAAYYRDCNHTDYGIDETLGSAWDTDSHTIATVSVGAVTCLAGGITAVRATWYDYTVASCMPPTTCTQCILTNAGYASGSGQVCAVQVSIQTQDNSRPFVFAGTNDSSVTAYNTQLAVGLPSGGKYLWSVAPETVTINPNNSTSAYLPTFTGNAASGSTGGTTETVQYTYPVTNGVTASNNRSITLRQFNSLTTATTKSSYPGDPDAPSPGLGYLEEFVYNIVTKPGSEQVESGFPGMTVGENVSLTSVSPPGTQVNLNTGQPVPTSTATQIYDCLGIPSSTALPSNLVVCATNSISVGGISVGTLTLKYTNTAVSIVATCP